MSEETITLNVARFRPGQDAAPTMQAYTVPYHKDWVVLDALNHIKDWIDQTLSHRWSCRMGVCGRCGMMVHGEPRLTCSAFLRDYYPNAITVEPLVNFPVMRDLVVDMSDFLDKLFHTTKIKEFVPLFKEAIEKYETPEAFLGEVAAYLPVRLYERYYDDSVPHSFFGLISASLLSQSTGPENGRWKPFAQQSWFVTKEKKRAVGIMKV